MEFPIFYLILGFAFAAVFLASYWIMANWNLKHKVRERVSQVEEHPDLPIVREEKKPGFLKGKILGWVSSSGQWAVKDAQKFSTVRENLIQAGFRQGQAPAVYFGLRVLCAFILPVPFLLFFIIKGKIAPPTLLVTFPISIFGFFLPAFVLSTMIKQRQTRLDKALPDVIDLFIICMEAGLALHSAVMRVAREIQGVYPDFCEELQLTSAELRTGIPWAEAFDNLGKRTGVQGIRSLVALMIQSDKMGTSIAQSLRTHSEFSRVQRGLRSEEKAAELPVKMIFPLALLILPAMLIVTAGPALIHVKVILRLFKGM
jgi:tight adherence protein C